MVPEACGDFILQKSFLHVYCIVGAKPVTLRPQQVVLTNFHMRLPQFKKGLQKVNTFRKTIVLCQSTVSLLISLCLWVSESIIYLWVEPVLWIRIHIGSVFRSLLDPDPHM